MFNCQFTIYHLFNVYLRASPKMNIVLNELMSGRIHECCFTTAICRRARACSERVVSRDTWITTKLPTYTHQRAATVVWECGTLTARIYRTPDKHSLITANFTCWVAINGYDGPSETCLDSTPPLSWPYLLLPLQFPLPTNHPPSWPRPSRPGYLPISKWHL